MSRYHVACQQDRLSVAAPVVRVNEASSLLYALCERQSATIECLHAGAESLQQTLNTLHQAAAQRHT